MMWGRSCPADAPRTNVLTLPKHSCCGVFRLATVCFTAWSAAKSRTICGQIKMVWGSPTVSLGISTDSAAFRRCLPRTFRHAFLPNSTCSGGRFALRSPFAGPPPTPTPKPRCEFIRNSAHAGLFGGRRKVDWHPVMTLAFFVGLRVSPGCTAPLGRRATESRRSLGPLDVPVVSVASPHRG